MRAWGWAGAAILAVIAAAGPAPSAHPSAAPAPAGPFATLLFSRTEITAADACVADDRGVARLDTVVADFLGRRGMAGTGTLTTARTRPRALTCTHDQSTLSASWRQARDLATRHGWSFTSHTATYPRDLAGLRGAEAEAETCGSAAAIDRRGLPGAHGLIAYPGAQPLPTALQEHHAAACFAWGRAYGGSGITAASAATTSPFWQRTYAANGGPCNEPTAPCHDIRATGSPRYRLPSELVAIVDALQPGQWFTLQAYVLVTGTSPEYPTARIRWDCTAADPRLHWTNDNERYCFRDYKAVVRALAGRTDITVTDPLTVGVAFGRPAVYR